MRVRVKSGLARAPVAQWIEQPPPKGQVARSIRVRGATFYINLDGAPGAPGNAKTMPASTPSDGARLRDGFLLPDATDDDEADALLTEYAENREKISALCAADLTKGFFYPLFGVDGDEATERVNEVLTLMARNFAIVEHLQGHDTVLLPTGAEAKREKRTTGDFVSARLTEALGLRNDGTARDE